MTPIVFTSSWGMWDMWGMRAGCAIMLEAGMDTDFRWMSVFRSA